MIEVETMNSSLPRIHRFVAFLIVGLALPVCAAVRLPALFSDSMVLQQGMPVPVWGWSDQPGEVTVSFAGQTMKVPVEAGRWRARLAPLKAGGPHELRVADASGEVRLTNVMVGEVWICSGQSNMEFPVERSAEAGESIPAATNNMIRLFKVNRARADSPAEDVQGRWVECSPESVRGFSAVGYYFGRDLQAARKVAVGLIGSSWGGTPAEAWTSPEMLQRRLRWRKEIIEGYQTALQRYRAALERFEQEKKEAQAAGREFKKRAPREPWAPSVLYNGMIAPLQPYAFKGAIWYQGESNASRAEQYRELFPDMIRSWREAWGQGDFPFLCVQLAPFRAIQEQPGESTWAELREAQWLATRVLPHVGMAVITDVGEEHDIHPKRKQPVGARLALAARALAYGESLEYSGPQYRQFKRQGRRLILSFDHVDGGLEARGGKLTGFAICGPDHRWVWAEAAIQPDNTVAVWSDDIPEPVAVRYGWADYPVVNLWNKAGLPATPFRTDDFPLITAGK